MRNINGFLSGTRDLERIFFNIQKPLKIDISVIWKLVLFNLDNFMKLWFCFGTALYERKEVYMETGTHFHLAKKIHALNSNRVEKKHCSFLRVLSKKKIKKWYVSCLLFVLKYFIFYCFFFIQYWNVYYNKWPMGHITQLTCPTIDSIQSALQSFKNYLDNGV